ncbi:electron transport complex protein RnfD [Hydrogenoanaerobacterium saccharovorans]|uniref:Electron transport complex protein RnfD n=1 Tax=Hydrogenoanaerobacterium saccharovorans TaxID=474960 RepID=A0A1H8B7D4_9FIRM|nr:RnfABCDGE type electron transport complex subunit D [Hydrogenoanaerobacterium saccharovorans]RPF47545.1 electron transport complex protein RnfD [Hydrogenoanaerobacterium saccharovorans]SEM78841.1 electron transport complex protein RnfD [Hydrogenoanaerobacterium saccharovorans]
MLLKDHNAPHIKARETNRTVMGDAIIALLPLYLMAFYFYGERAAMLGLVSVGTCVAADILCILLRGQKINLRDFSPVVTGMMLPLLLPASIPYHIVIIGGLFAIIFVKQPFGGVGQNLFNPAAGAFALMAISWPDKVFLYPEPLMKLEAFGEITSKLVEGSAHTLKLGGVPVINTLDMITGNFAGPMGATNILVLTTCLIYLIFRKTVSWQVPISFLATTALMAYCFPRIPTSGFSSVVLEMLSGSLMFGAVFMLTDPVTAPKRGLSKYFYGIISAVVTMLFRRYGGYEQTVMFAILLMNAFAPVIDRVSEFILRILRRMNFEPKKRNKTRTIQKPHKAPAQV